MSIKLAQLQSRIEELEKFADRIQELATGLAQLQDVQPELLIKTQQWYRGTRELLVKHQFSGLAEFEQCYEFYDDWPQKTRRGFTDIKDYTSHGTTPSNGFTTKSNASNYYEMFLACFRRARALLLACMEEIKSRELPIKSQLSLEISTDEFKAANELIGSTTDETLIRAAGVIARVAMERHLWTILDVHSIAIQKNPSQKKKADTQDLLTTLVKAAIITPIQKSEMDFLFKIGNNCAHPKEVVAKNDVERLIIRGQELASVIL